MPNNSTKIMLIFTLMTGTFISISSNSWLGAWMGLEINLLSFIPLMINHTNLFTMEASLKYFIVQAMASSMLLFIIIMISISKINMYMFNTSYFSLIINTPLLLKSGSAPFHWWFPSTMEGLSWNNCMMLLTIQKIAPLMLISYTITSSMIIFIIMSTITGAIGGFNQTSIRKMITYSSINHMGWMLAAMLIGENLWLMYFSIYSLMTLSIISLIKPFKISFINQLTMMDKKMSEMKIITLSLFLSLGGLPPFLGFLPKWIIIQFMIMNNMTSTIMIMIMMSLVTLFYYIRICYSTFLLNHNNTSWNSQIMNNFIIKYNMLIISLSILGLMLCTMLVNVS